MAKARTKPARKKIARKKVAKKPAVKMPVFIEQQQARSSYPGEILSQIRDLELRLAAIDPFRRRWPTALFQYGHHVKVKPFKDAPGRVLDLHVLGQAHTIEYTVRFINLEGRAVKMRLFEDELVSETPPPMTWREREGQKK